jgi:hypothetical protein
MVKGRMDAFSDGVIAIIIDIATIANCFRRARFCAQESGGKRLEGKISPLHYAIGQSMFLTEGAFPASKRGCPSGI